MANGRRTAQGPAFNLDRMGPPETSMTSHSIDADIKVKWPEGQSAYSPGTAEELSLIAIDLLVKEMGSDAARSFIDQVFERYRHEPIAAPAQVLTGRPQPDPESTAEPLHE